MASAILFALADKNGCTVCVCVWVRRKLNLQISPQFFLVVVISFLETTE
jgi:hypothetical protein